jgi:hypothetical protein
MARCNANINLDNMASTPPLVAVRDALHEFASWYASLHRGSGYKSRLSTHARSDGAPLLRR